MLRPVPLGHSLLASDQHHDGARDHFQLRISNLHQDGVLDDVLARGQTSVEGQMPAQVARQARNLHRYRFPMGVDGDIDDIITVVFGIQPGEHDCDGAIVGGGVKVPGTGTVFAESGQATARGLGAIAQGRMFFAQGDQLPDKFEQTLVARQVVPIEPADGVVRGQ